MNEVALKFYAKYPELFICECPFCHEISQRLQSVESVEDREILLDPFFIEIRRTNREGRSEIIRQAIMNWSGTRVHYMFVRNQGN